jgi:hypothetical protein
MIAAWPARVENRFDRGCGDASTVGADNGEGAGGEWPLRRDIRVLPIGARCASESSLMEKQ